ncbi:hypothetical protein HG535_0H00480 [Zygotorulaspora mrakii]|uniref:UBX domain-containing protein n=1 Tax=Zygotorulaspora mrakii TaxID=42260 RepID=A0A7H9B890_ZYGMR|nr:uncharacterized protein HG535_0H00480 [Zygotorulaspora mrakii]QLG74723.1 hypothetical protein HG535_0H00480 [Zygotorulaspora mrakii]
MSTVAVEYKFSTFRVKVSPNTILNDVLKDSLKHFKLINQKSSENLDSWSLLHKEKPVALDLPWRLMNLSAGAKLDLKEGQRRDSESSRRTPHIVRIKMQVVDFETVIDEVDVNENIKTVIAALAHKYSWPLDPQETKLQVFSKTIPYSDFQSNTLSNLGIRESALIKLYIHSDRRSFVQKTSSEQQGTPAEAPAADMKTSIDDKGHELHKILAFVPPKVPIHSQISNDDEDDYELTVAHARIYQQLLSKQTGALGGSLISKRMKEERENGGSKSAVTECNVRVRFPNLSHIEATFAPEDNVHMIYQVVANSLIEENLDFKLSFSHPYELLLPSEKGLVKDLGFGCRTLLIFESPQEGPYLKEAILKEAKELNEADDVKLDHLDAESKSGDETARVTKPSAQVSNSSIAVSGEKKVPKWLRLSKK